MEGPFAIFCSVLTLCLFSLLLLLLSKMGLENSLEPGLEKIDNTKPQKSCRKTFTLTYAAK